MAAILVQLKLGRGGVLGCYLLFGIPELLCFPDLTQGKAVIYDEKINEAIYDYEIYEAIYVKLPVDDNDASLEEGQDKWGNVRVLYPFMLYW